MIAFMAVSFAFWHVKSACIPACFAFFQILENFRELAAQVHKWCTGMQTTLECQVTAMTKQTVEDETDEGFEIVAQPRTAGGKPIFWQCELYPSADQDTLPGSSWVDYAKNYNIVLEAAYQAQALTIRIDAPADQPEGHWDCDVVLMIQTNSATMVKRNMRRVVVTMPAACWDQ
jgi:hypothetical protein